MIDTDSEYDVYNRKDKKKSKLSEKQIDYNYMPPNVS